MLGEELNRQCGRRDLAARPIHALRPGESCSCQLNLGKPKVLLVFLRSGPL